MNEELKQCLGYPNYYATKSGKIWSEKSKKFLSTNTKSKGYCKVNLYDENGVMKNVRVHRIIWQAFNGIIPDGLEVNHKNSIREDNRLENLELLSHRENLLYGDGLEKRRQAQIQKVKRGGSSNFANPIKLKGVTDCSNYYFPSRTDCALYFKIKPKRLTYLLGKMKNNRITIDETQFIVE